MSGTVYAAVYDSLEGWGNPAAASYTITSPFSGGGGGASPVLVPAVQTGEAVSITGSSAALNFTDVPASYWAHGAIGSLRGLGYISGYPDGSFRPDRQITRAEFCVIMDKALKLTPYTPQAPTFSDVHPADWFYQSVQTAVYAGIVKGYGDGTFRPDSPISRQEMACVLVQALGKSQLADSHAPAVTRFVDDHDIAGWSRGYIFVALQQGIVSGYPDGAFKPENDATRAESCAMISIFLQKK